MLPGFITRGNGFLKDAETRLRIRFKVEDLTQQTSGAMLALTEFGDRGRCELAPCNYIGVGLTAPGQPAFGLDIGSEQLGNRVLGDSGQLPQPGSEIELEIEIEIEFELECEPGFGCARALWVGGVAALFYGEVPEPGAFALSEIVLDYCPQTQLLINDAANEQADHVDSVDQCVVGWDVCQAGASSTIGSIRCVNSLYRCRVRGIYQELFSKMAYIRGFVIAYRQALMDARRQRVDDLFPASTLAQECTDGVLDAMR
jgi:hypothetical protein